MIKGMTGFGHAEMANGTIKAAVEIKTVNHRYLDYSYYLPPGFGSLENKIREIVQTELERGRVSISIKIIHKVSHSVHVNKDVVRAHLKNAHNLAKEFGLRDDLALTDVIKLPGVIETKETSMDPDELWPILEKCLKRSLTGVVLMRKREGKSLFADVSQKLKIMDAQIKIIIERSNAILKEMRQKLTEEEFKSFQKSVDINEELSRLDHYIDEMKILVKSDVAVGKKVDFIAQEMQRETNTIGSKLQDRTVSTAVITLKSKIEKIREQAQNIE